MVFADDSLVFSWFIVHLKDHSIVEDQLHENIHPYIHVQVIVSSKTWLEVFRELSVFKYLIINGAGKHLIKSLLSDTFKLHVSTLGYKEYIFFNVLRNKIFMHAIHKLQFKTNSLKGWQELLVYFSFGEWFWIKLRVG